MRVPRSTYRLQVTPTWTLIDAAKLVPQLHRLGADWVYLSPLLQAETGSEHGYDVIDHGDVDPARGGGEGLAALADAAHEADMGVLVDIVPNHVGVATPRRATWWWDVLRARPRVARTPRRSTSTGTAGGNRMRIPVLGDEPTSWTELEIVDGELRYHDQRFPIAAGTGDGTAREVHDRQHYELVNWRRADAELNYRRFFAVNTLAGDPRRGPVGVRRVARRDRALGRTAAGSTACASITRTGCADPGRIPRRARRRATGGAYVLVEKILEGDEQLPASWAVRGHHRATTRWPTSTGCFVDPRGEGALDELDTPGSGAGLPSTGRR